MALFQHMEKCKLHLNNAIYNILIENLCKAGQLKSAKELFHSLSNKGLQPDVKTYTIMIRGLFSEGLTSEVNKSLKVMEENRCSPNDFTYNTIIRGLIGNSGCQGQF